VSDIDQLDTALRGAAAGEITIESSMSLILAQLDLHPEDGISTRVAAVLANLDAFTSGSA